MTSPAWIAQGWWLRKSALRLPETMSGIPLTSQATQQLDSKAREISLLITGDSVAAGVGVNEVNSSLSGQLHHCITEQYGCRVSTSTVAKSGLNITGLYQLLLANTGERYSHIVISIGVNDAKGFISTRKWRQQLTQLINLVNSHYSKSKVCLLAIPDFAGFTLLKPPLSWVLSYRSMRLNKVSMQLARTTDSFELLSTNMKLDHQLFASDGFHPNLEGNKSIAESIYLSQFFND